MSIRNLYEQVIRRLMRASGVAGAQKPPPWRVLPNASFADVLRYTAWYAIARGKDQPHFRFDKYHNAVDRALKPKTKKSPWTHIDIGCGAGVFSWAFLDWANERGIECSDVALYGYDACQQMVRLAWMLRARLRNAIPNYPDLRYYHDGDALIRKLASKRIDADCLITFGYVLAGNHTDDDIPMFQRIASVVLDAALPERKVYLLASDATSGGNLRMATAGWKKLLAALETKGAGHQTLPVLTSLTGDRCVLLSR